MRQGQKSYHRVSAVNHGNINRNDLRHMTGPYSLTLLVRHLYTRAHIRKCHIFRSLGLCPGSPPASASRPQGRLSFGIAPQGRLWFEPSLLT